MNKIILLISGLIACIFVAAVVLFFNKPANDCPASAGAGSVDIGGNFSLTDHLGNPVNVPDLFDGNPALVYFGYTYCPDFCPNDLGRMTRVIQTLEDSGQKIKPVFVTIDPKRDTQEVIKDYAEHFHKDLSILRGTAEETALAAKAYKVYYAENPDEDFSDGYMMSHSTLTYLMNSKGEYLQHFRTEETDDVMLKKMQCALN